jgi:predicted nucleotidyltransferase
MLRAIAAHYEPDPRVILVGVFGSLARGDWHHDSDLDLDVVLTDDVVVDPLAELQALGASLAAIGEHIALAVPDGPDAAHGVLASLARFSVRYHPIAATSPNIVESLVAISAKGDLGAVLAAGRANTARRPPQAPAWQLVDECIRYCLETKIAVDRGQLWLGQELLSRVRDALVALFAQSHGASRPIHFFDTHAPPVLHARLSVLLAAHHAPGLYAAVLNALDALEHHLADFAGTTTTLTDEQRAVIAATRLRLDQ